MPRLRILAIWMLVCIGALLASAAPASAHDQLLSSSPNAGERLQASPTQVSLRFSNEPLTIGDAGMTVFVVDAAGKDWVVGSPTADTTTVTAELAEGMPEAGYQVRWQIVSADGHPIRGVIPFTVGDAEPLASAIVPAANGVDAGARRTDGQQTAQSTQPAIRTVLIGAGGAAAAVALFVLVQLLRRRASAGGSEDLEHHEEL